MTIELDDGFDLPIPKTGRLINKWIKRSTIKKVCNPREEGVASDNAGASVFVHNDDDKTNNQCVRVELIYVFDYYISQEGGDVETYCPKIC